MQPLDGGATARLRSGWARRLVSLGSLAAAGIVATALIEHPAPAVVWGIRLGCLLAAVMVLWFLADFAHPWIADPSGIAAEERAHADAAVRRSYGALFGIAVAVLLYLLWSSAAPGNRYDPVVERVLLATFTGIALLLPLGIAAWTAVEGDLPGTEVGPLELVQWRMRGEATLPFAVGLVAAVMIVVMTLLAAARSLGLTSVWTRGIAATALTVAVVCALACLRALLEHSLDRSQNGRL